MKQEQNYKWEKLRNMEIELWTIIPVVATLGLAITQIQGTSIPYWLGFNFVVSLGVGIFYLGDNIRRKFNG